MASSRDVKDIMGLVASDSGSKPATTTKKSKIVAAKRLTGINREILALHGDRAPPVSIIDSTKTFRAKLKRDFRPARWEFAPFTNDARSDGLKMRHWKRQELAKAGSKDVGVETMDTEDKNSEPLYPFARYNVEISVPEYDDSKYNAHLRSDDWSREETDYLIGLVKEYAQKWPVIIDRYNWAPRGQESPETSSHSTGALVKAQEPRTLEALKDRYYKIWARCLAIEHGGESGMNETEFQLYETLTKYDPGSEVVRKELAWRLFERSLEDIREEEYLLSELQRIMISAQRFESERAEVRQRLEPAVGRTSNGNVPTSSADLNQLYLQLFQQDRSRRARGRLSINANELLQSPHGIGSNGTTMTAGGHRDSIASAGGMPKKGSISIQQTVRTLDSSSEKRYGVTTHDRLTSGVTFRSDKLLKLRQAKSQIQTQKIAAALVELNVPDILQLPTQRVLDAFESLVQKVQKLVDARKVVEKEEAEARIQGGLRQELHKENDSKDTEEPDTKLEETHDGEEDAEGDEDDGDDDDDSQFEARENVDEEEIDDIEGEEDADGEEEGDRVDADEMDIDSSEVMRPSSGRSASELKRSASVLSDGSNVSKRSKQSG